MTEQISMLALSAIVVGLVQIIKGLGLPSKWVPLIALVLGIAIAFVGRAFIPGDSTSEIVLYGLIMGLSSMGLYSGGKTITDQLS